MSEKMTLSEYFVFNKEILWWKQDSSIYINKPAAQAAGADLESPKDLYLVLYFSLYSYLISLKE